VPQFLVVLSLLALTEGGSIQNYGEVRPIKNETPFWPKPCPKPSPHFLQVEVVRLNDPQIVAETPWEENGSSAMIHPETPYQPKRGMKGKNSLFQQAQNNILLVENQAVVTDPTMVYKNAKKKVDKLESALTR